jgi:hypothetical protein
MRSRTIRTVALLLLPFLLLVGCSDDDGDDDSASGSGSGSASVDSDDRTTSTNEDGSTVSSVEGGTITQGTPPPNAPPAITAAERREYCGVWGRLKAVGGKEYDHGDPNAVKAHYNELVAVARELLAAAPADIKGAVEITLKGAEQVAASGDTTADDTDEVRVNGQRLQDYAAQHCK